MKILISLVACFIAAGSFIGYNLTENTSRLDVSLADISVMAQADGESGDPQWVCKCSWWSWAWGNKECRADNGGKSCHYDEAFCRDHDPLCGS